MIRIDGTTIKLIQHPDAEYSSFLWPCALILTRYLVSSQYSDSQTLNVIEVGAGIALPSLLLASKIRRSCILATDVSGVENIQNEICENDLDDHCFAERLAYGDTESAQKLLGAYFLCSSGSKHPVDLILASDVFYDNHLDWEAILESIKCMLVSLSNCCADLLEKTSAKCILAYQERSSKRSIQFLLDELNLIARQLPLEDLKDYTDDVVWVNDSDEVPVRLEGLESVFLFEISIKFLE